MTCTEEGRWCSCGTEIQEGIIFKEISTLGLKRIMNIFFKTVMKLRYDLSEDFY